MARPNLSKCVREDPRPNLTSEPRLVQRSAHLCRVRVTYARSSTEVAGPAGPPKPTAKIKSALPSDTIALDHDGVMPDDIKGEGSGHCTDNLMMCSIPTLGATMVPRAHSK